MDIALPFSLASLYTLDGDLDYDRVKEFAHWIVSGSGRIVRLNDFEERGRILGGQRNVEASLIAGASERADRQRIDEGRPIQRSEEALEAYARNEGIWFDFDDDLNDKLPQVAEGFEAFVFLAEDEGFVLKAAHFADCSPLEALDERVALFNYLFPETAYELIGFTSCREGKFRFVLRQPIIIGEVGVDDAKALARRMKEAGLFATTDPEKLRTQTTRLGMFIA